MGKRRASNIEEGERETPSSILKRITTWSPPVIWSAAIFYSSTLPGSSIHLPQFKFVDKLIHVLVFGILTLLVLRIGWGSENKIKAFYFGILYSILYGLIDEIHQFFVPGRFTDPFDFLANVVGVLVGCLIFTRFFGGLEGGKEHVEV